MGKILEIYVHTLLIGNEQSTKIQSEIEKTFDLLHRNKGLVSAWLQTKNRSREVFLDEGFLSHIISSTAETMAKLLIIKHKEKFTFDITEERDLSKISATIKTLVGSKQTSLLSLVETFSSSTIADIILQHGSAVGYEEIKSKLTSWLLESNFSQVKRTMFFMHILLSLPERISKLKNSIGIIGDNDIILTQVALSPEGSSYNVIPDIMIIDSRDVEKVGLPAEKAKDHQSIRVKIFEIKTRIPSERIRRGPRRVIKQKHREQMDNYIKFIDDQFPRIKIETLSVVYIDSIGIQIIEHI